MTAHWPALLAAAALAAGAASCGGDDDGNGGGEAPPRHAPPRGAAAQRTRVIDLPPERVVELTPAELAQYVLRDMVATGEWSSWDYINETQQAHYRGPAAYAISGALGWLQGQDLITQAPRNGSTWSAIVVTPAGRRVAAGR